MGKKKMKMKMNLSERVRCNIFFRTRVIKTRDGVNGCVLVFVDYDISYYIHIHVCVYIYGGKIILARLYSILKVYIANAWYISKNTIKNVSFLMEVCRYIAPRYIRAYCEGFALVQSNSRD